MRAFAIKLLKGLRLAYRVLEPNSIRLNSYDNDPDSVSFKIRELLMSDIPIMIGRFGAVELAAMSNYLGVKSGLVNISDFIRGNSSPWWWEKEVVQAMYNNAGFFPPNEHSLERFCEMMIKDIPMVDMLGSWLAKERFFEKEMSNPTKVRLIFLDPFWAKVPWTEALAGKKVLIVHPFSNTIEQQYKKRKQLFVNNLLPEFELLTIQAVQSIAGTPTEYEDWFEALTIMKDQIDKLDYDVCLIGCGAYGFPLAAHVKRAGKKAIHLGGSLQLLFGIRGKRWENEKYSDYNYVGLINEHWVKPSDEERPFGATKVENACYW